MELHTNSRRLHRRHFGYAESTALSLWRSYIDAREAPGIYREQQRMRMAQARMLRNDLGVRRKKYADSYPYA